MKTSISQCYVDSSHQISSLRTSCMKNEINLMKTSISQCYVDSSHQISCNVTNFTLYEKWNKFNENKYFAMLRW